MPGARPIWWRLLKPRHVASRRRQQPGGADPVAACPAASRARSGRSIRPILKSPASNAIRRSRRCRKRRTPVLHRGAARTHHRDRAGARQARRRRLRLLRGGIRRGGARRASHCRRPWLKRPANWRSWDRFPTAILNYHRRRPYVRIRARAVRGPHAARPSSARAATSR